MLIGGNSRKVRFKCSPSETMLGKSLCAALENLRRGDVDEEGISFVVIDRRPHNLLGPFKEWWPPDPLRSVGSMPIGWSTMHKIDHCSTCMDLTQCVGDDKTGFDYISIRRLHGSQKPLRTNLILLIPVF